MRNCLLISLLALCTAAASPVKAQNEDEIAPEPAVLWRGLAIGMTPEEALPILQAMEGIKRVKLRKPKRSNPERRLSIRYKSGNIPIAGMPFKVAPRFSDGRLDQVVLATQNQCGVKALSSYDAIATALQSKYPQSLSGPEGMTASEINAAESKSYDSGEPNRLSYGFANDRVAVLLSFQIQVEAPPPYPASYSRLASSLWRLARTQYEHRKEECSGKGDRRMDIVIQYMQRSIFEAAKEKVLNEEQQEREQLAEQL